MLRRKIKFFLFFFILSFSSCVHESSVRNKSLVALNNTSVSIEMPKNILVFENIAPVIYEELYNHLNRVGFNLSDKINPDFILKSEVKKLERFGKIISPDILSYGFNFRLEVLCYLFDKNNKLLKTKEFKVPIVVYKPEDQILNSNFYSYSYEKLAKRIAIKIEQYFRPYFLNKKINEV